MVFDLETDTVNKTLSVSFFAFLGAFLVGVWGYFVTWIGVLLISICFMFKGSESFLFLLSVDFGKFVVSETFWWGKILGVSCNSGWVSFLV